MSATEAEVIAGVFQQWHWRCSRCDREHDRGSVAWQLSGFKFCERCIAGDFEDEPCDVCTEPVLSWAGRKKPIRCAYCRHNARPCRQCSKLFIPKQGDKCCSDQCFEAFLSAQREKAYRTWFSQIPAMFQTTKIERLPRRKLSEGLLTRFKAESLGDWYYFHGTTGRGKSRTLMLCLGERVRRGETVIVTSAIEFQRQVGRPGDHDELLDELRECDVLAWEETEKSTQSPRASIEWFDLVKFREEHCSGPILFVSQLPLKALRAQLSDHGNSGVVEAFMRRARERCIVADFDCEP